MSRKVRNSITGGTREDNKIPVFVFPEELIFTNEDIRRVLTVYNPYDYRIQFRVLCSNPSNYVVRNPKGVIVPKTCVDIIIRFQLRQEETCTTTDKFRIDMFKDESLIGQKTVSSVFRFTPSVKSTKEEQSLKLLEFDRDVNPASETQERYFHLNHSRLSCGFVIIVIISLVSIIVVFLPLEGDTASSLPQYMYVSIQAKLLAAFVLGMFTMFFIKT